MSHTRVDEQTNFHIYLLPNIEDKTLRAAEDIVARQPNGCNAILLFPEPKGASSSSGSQKYHARYIINGLWLNELDRRKEVSIGERNFGQAKTKVMSYIPKIKCMLPETPNYKNILNMLLGYGGIQLSQFEKLYKDIHHSIQRLQDDQSLVNTKTASRKLYSFYQPEDRKRVIKNLFERGIRVTAYDIKEIKKILLAPFSVNPPNLDYLREVLCTRYTVKDHRGRIHQDRTIAQIFIGMRSDNVDSEKGNRVINGLVEWIYENCYKRLPANGDLPDGETLWAEHYFGQLPPGYEKEEEKRVAEESSKLNQMMKIVKEKQALCQQTLALDSFHGYDLRNTAWTHNNENEILASAIYLEAGAEGLACSFRTLNGQVTTKLLKWDKLVNFPHDVNKIINPPYQLCPLPSPNNANAALENEKLYVAYDSNKKILRCSSLDLKEDKKDWQIKLSDLMERLGEDDWPRLKEALARGDLNQLKDFLPTILEISAERNMTLSKQTYLAMLLEQLVEQLTEPGEFYTREQIQQLKVLSDATIKAPSSDAFNASWDELQRYIKSIVGESTDLTLLKALYDHRNSFEPKGVYTTGHHSNPYLFKEFCELYDKNFTSFGNNGFSPANVFCAQKLGGFSQAGGTAEELQLNAQGLFNVLHDGNKLKGVFSYRLGSGSILPLAGPSLSILRNCMGLAAAMPGWSPLDVAAGRAALVGFLMSSKNISATKTIPRPGNQGCTIM